SLQNNSFVAYAVSNGGHWVYANTGFNDGDSVPGIMGYEADRLFSNYPAPNSVTGSHVLLSHSPFTSNGGTADYGNSSIYQAMSGAWVFGAGTIAWGWGLDGSRADSRMQQTTANILDRFIGNPA